MRYEVFTLLIVLAIPMLAGLALVVDGVRRGINKLRRSNRDLHA